LEAARILAEQENPIEAAGSYEWDSVIGHLSPYPTETLSIILRNAQWALGLESQSGRAPSAAVVFARVAFAVQLNEKRTNAKKVSTEIKAGTWLVVASAAGFLTPHTGVIPEDWEFGFWFIAWIGLFLVATLYVSAIFHFRRVRIHTKSAEFLSQFIDRHTDDDCG
jgi:hypothetical protein